MSDDLQKTLDAFAGTPAGPTGTCPYPVNEPMIHHWCDATGDRNPAYLDPAAAKETGRDGVIAPPAMLQAWTMRGLRPATADEEALLSRQRHDPPTTGLRFFISIGSENDADLVKLVGRERASSFRCGGPQGDGKRILATHLCYAYSPREAEVLKNQPKPCSIKEALERAVAWSTEHAPIILRFNGHNHYEPTVVFDTEWKTFCAQHFPDHVLDGHAA